jgi:hypothetical protein
MQRASHILVTYVAKQDQEGHFVVQRNDIRSELVIGYPRLTVLISTLSISSHLFALTHNCTTCHKTAMYRSQSV